MDVMKWKNMAAEIFERDKLRDRQNRQEWQKQQQYKPGSESRHEDDQYECQVIKVRKTR